ncbi:restriction endonuclease [Pseudomonas viridiflava]|uniref:restriction endonuclease n=1 Tax=Pseudomonas viridiflava TaxID=33069 RepID=UPI002A6A5E09|nr:restriction endonuclease [Pseudomonas viridiflava]MDY0916627.1 restriction endonuclease [Pseudomonas viridiflava]
MAHEKPATSRLFYVCNDLQRFGGSGDTGIDRIISRHKPGLEKVYVQAKRWQNTVDSPELHAFCAA